MKRIRLITVKSHSPNGSRRYQVGEVYEALENHAKLLIAAGFVKIEEASPVDPPPKKREYRTRDMKAQS